MPAQIFAMMGFTLILLFGFLFGVLAAVGYYFGFSGYTVVFLAIILVIVQWLISPQIIRWTTNMQEISKKEYPWLFEIVEKVTKKTKTPMPKKVMVVNSGGPNAFVFGRTPGNATLCVTRGLLKTLNRDEVEAVVAHEIGHINHKDMVVMTFASAIPTIMYFIAQFLIYTPNDRDRKNAGAAVLVGFFAFIIYFITNLLVLALSRFREYYADRFSAQQGNSKTLANALAKITYGLSLARDQKNEAVRALYIADPISAAGEISRFSNEYQDLELTESEIKKAMEWERSNFFARISEIFSSHPLSWKRILALQKIENEIKK